LAAGQTNLTASHSDVSTLVSVTRNRRAAEADSTALECDFAAAFRIAKAAASAQKEPHIYAKLNPPLEPSRLH
jgi:hypothetical protein